MKQQRHINAGNINAGSNDAWIGDRSAGTWEVDAAYRWCGEAARQHYENFPVGSLLIPRPLRRHVHAIYAFARAADDLADEEAYPVAERIALLDEWEGRLDEAIAGRPVGPIFTAVADTLRRTSIPERLLRDLLVAFRHDARNLGYENEEDLIGYCRCSANPVGRMILHLFGYDDARRLELSDQVCTGLQLVNFWQDLSVDVPRGRLNIPLETLRRFGIAAGNLNDSPANENTGALLSYLIRLADERLRAGAPLVGTIPDLRLRLELKATVAGGLAVLEKTRRLGSEVFRERPRLRSGDWLRLVIRIAGPGL